MSRDAEVLNLLIARLRGASAAYRRAGADGPGLSDAFGGAAAAHDRTAEALEAELRALGGAPDPGAVCGSPAWSGLAGAVAAGAEGVGAAVERAETELLRDVHAAMEDAGVSGSVREVIGRAHGLVSAGRDRALRRLAALAP